MAQQRLQPTVPVDLVLTLRPFYRGRGDPSMRLARHQVERAGRGPDGGFAIRIWRIGDELRAEAWGPGADWAIDGLPCFLGLDDDAGTFDATAHPLVARLARRMAGLRIGRTRAVMEALVPAILEQKVTGSEASRAYRGLVARFGEPAPGPLGLRLPPTADALAALPYFAFHPLGVEQRRAEVIRRVARDAAKLEALVDGAPAELHRRLIAYPGIGPWTAAEVAARAQGDPDAVSLGDFHLPNLVAWTLAGEPRGDDARLLALLERWPGQRGRVIRILEASGLAAPRYGPRMAPNSIEGL